jgi:ATP-binding cassette subfamily C protein
MISRRDRKKIILVTLLQIFMGGLDLLGVAFIGVLGALTINGIESRSPGNRVSSVLGALNLESESFQFQAASLAVLAAGILIFRTVLSIIFARKTLFFLSRRAAVISTELIHRLLNQTISGIQSRSSQASLYAVTTGVSNITLGVIGTAVSVVSDTALLAVMATGLFIVDPIMAVSSLILFGLIGLTLYFLLQSRARNLGSQEAQLNVESNERIIEVLMAFRETHVRNRSQYYSEEIGKIRAKLSNTLAETSFMPNISKYVLETSVILGAIVISAIQFKLQDASRAVGTLSIFIAAGTRIAPAVLRVQQGAITIKGGLGSSKLTLDLFENLPPYPEYPEGSRRLKFDHPEFTGKISINDLSFSYSENSDFSLKNINLEVKSGEKIAIVGPSGSGKSTLIDLLIGVLQPTSGSITISETSIAEVIKQFPGSIGYVPQDIFITSSSFKDNVALGYSPEEVEYTRIHSALDQVQLLSYINQLPEGIETLVGERGAFISGGQRQRLGIARALYTNPRILILDEATSSLDGSTEKEVSEAIQKLKGTVTLVIIAHRLSTVRDADKVVYVEEGEIIHVGTFDEIRQNVPNFDYQAKLMGL